MSPHFDMTTRDDLPIYGAPAPLYYGTEISIVNDRLFLSCDKYRDMHSLEKAADGRIDVIHYGHDNIYPPKVVGSIYPQSVKSTLLRVFQAETIKARVDSTFVITAASSPQCIYCEFTYGNRNYYWRVRYDSAKLLDCILFLDNEAISTFVPDGKFHGMTQSIGQLFMPCIAAEWPIELPDADERPKKFDGIIAYHAKALDIELMRISFLAVWLRVLKGTLHRFNM